MKPSWKKWVLIGAGVGAGAVLMATLVVGSVAWRSSQPRSWNSAAVRASFSTFLLSVIDEKKVNGMELEYVLENKGKTDFTLTPDQTFMLVDGGALRKSVTGRYKVSQPCFVPTGDKVKCTISVPTDFDTSFKIGGFVVFDESTRYRIVFPSPTLPTPEDQKKMRTQFTVLKEGDSQ